MHPEGEHPQHLCSPIRLEREWEVVVSEPRATFREREPQQLYGGTGGGRTGAATAGCAV